MQHVSREFRGKERQFSAGNYSDHEVCSRPESSYIVNADVVSSAPRSRGLEVSLKITPYKSRLK